MGRRGRWKLHNVNMNQSSNIRKSNQSSNIRQSNKSSNIRQSTNITQYANMSQSPNVNPSFNITQVARMFIFITKSLAVNLLLSAGAQNKCNS